ncbi:MAG: 4Fe-4S binding protein [Enterocloster aldenensis]
MVQDECTQCGACLNACDEDAIVRAGSIKPKCPRKPVPCRR